MTKTKSQIFSDPGMRSVFIDPSTNDTWREGERYFRPKLARTLRAVAEKGPDAFYQGEIADGIVNDLTLAGGIITKEDLKNYKCAKRSRS